MHILDLLPAFCSATGKRKPAQRVYLISLVSQCVSLILQLLSQHSDIWNISGLKTRNSRWRDWKKISPRLPLCLSACLSIWLTQPSRVWIWIKFHLSAFWATCFLANDLSPHCCNPSTMMLRSGASSISQSTADQQLYGFMFRLKGKKKETQGKSHLFSTFLSPVVKKKKTYD